MASATINGTDIFYAESGCGVPCLVMHGGLGVDHTQFREWLDPLGDVLHLIYCDHHYNVRSRLCDIAAPTLILTGREDFFCPPAQAEHLHTGITGSRLVIFEHSGHYPFAEEGEAFQRAVRTWLQAVSASPREGRGSMAIEVPPQAR